MQNYNTVKNVEEFAHLGGYTTTTFRRLFKNLYGIPVYEWILEKKREGILEDLQRTNMRITEICNRYGFDSLSHFAHFCKDSFGDTPRALRKKAANGEKNRKGCRLRNNFFNSLLNQSISPIFAVRKRCKTLKF